MPNNKKNAEMRQIEIFISNEKIKSFVVAAAAAIQMAADFRFV